MIKKFDYKREFIQNKGKYGIISIWEIGTRSAKLAKKKETVLKDCGIDEIL